MLVATTSSNVLQPKPCARASQYRHTTQLGRSAMRPAYLFALRSKDFLYSNTSSTRRRYSQHLLEARYPSRWMAPRQSRAVKDWRCRSTQMCWRSTPFERFNGAEKQRSEERRVGKEEN